MKCGPIHNESFEQPSYEKISQTYLCTPQQHKKFSCREITEEVTSPAQESNCYPSNEARKTPIPE